MSHEIDVLFYFKFLLLLSSERYFSEQKIIMCCILLRHFSKAAASKPFYQIHAPRCWLLFVFLDFKALFFYFILCCIHGSQTKYHPRLIFYTPNFFSRLIFEVIYGNLIELSSASFTKIVNKTINKSKYGCHLTVK